MEVHRQGYREENLRILHGPYFEDGDSDSMIWMFTGTHDDENEQELKRGQNEI
jgi:hypothetical protein